MTFYPTDYEVPKSLKKEEYILRPLRKTDNELDYKAVMESMHTLRKISNSTWPEDGFTLEDNYRDLYDHETDHNKRKEFTYTIMNPNESLCLGCLYIRPTPSIIQTDGLFAIVRFWIRESKKTEDLDQRVLVDIIEWLKLDWHFTTVYFQTGIDATRQINLYKSTGLMPVDTNIVDDSSGFLYFQLDIDY
jgi:hypothetical protein